MKTLSLRKFAYVAALTLSAINLTSIAASAQDARGQFTLTHEVHWQNAVVPAGDYKFNLKTEGPAEMLTLQKLSGNGGGFMMLINDSETVKLSGASKIVVVPRAGASFVSEMELPNLGLKLHFTVPAAPALAASTKTGPPATTLSASR